MVGTMQNKFVVLCEQADTNDVMGLLVDVKIVPMPLFSGRGWIITTDLDIGQIRKLFIEKAPNAHYAVFEVTDRFYRALGDTASSISIAFDQS